MGQASATACTLPTTTCNFTQNKPGVDQGLTSLSCPPVCLNNNIIPSLDFENKLFTLKGCPEWEKLVFTMHRFVVGGTYGLLSA